MFFSSNSQLALTPQNLHCRARESEGNVKGRKKGEERVLEPRSRGRGKDGGAGNAVLEWDSPGTSVPLLRLWRVFLVWVCALLPAVAETAGRKNAKAYKMNLFFDNPRTAGGFSTDKGLCIIFRMLKALQVGWVSCQE